MYTYHTMRDLTIALEKATFIFARNTQGERTLCVNYYCPYSLQYFAHLPWQRMPRILPQMRLLSKLPPRLIKAYYMFSILVMEKTNHQHCLGRAHRLKQKHLRSSLTIVMPQVGF